MLYFWDFLMANCFKVHYICDYLRSSLVQSYIFNERENIGDKTLSHVSDRVWPFMTQCNGVESFLKEHCHVYYLLTFDFLWFSYILTWIIWYVRFREKYVHICNRMIRTENSGKLILCLQNIHSSSSWEEVCQANLSS